MLGTVAKAGQVLDAFTPERPEWGVTELACHLGFPKSNAHELLASLAAIDLLQRAPGGRYRLGWRVVAMAGGHAEATLLRKHAPAHLGALARCGGQTAHLAVWDGREMFFVAQATAVGGVDNPRARPGAVIPGHATATGKVLLGLMPWSEAIVRLRYDGFPPLTSATITDEEILREEVEGALRNGYAVAREEAVVGVSSIAVPVSGPAGHVIAALGVSMRPGLLAGYLHRHLRTMTETAGRLGRSLREAT